MRDGNHGRICSYKFLLFAGCWWIYQPLFVGTGPCNKSIPHGAKLPCFLSAMCRWRMKLKIKFHDIFLKYFCKVNHTGTDFQIFRKLWTRKKIVNFLFFMLPNPWIGGLILKTLSCLYGIRNLNISILLPFVDLEPLSKI